jgi:hypothetical protein
MIFNLQNYSILNFPKPFRIVCRTFFQIKFVLRKMYLQSIKISCHTKKILIEFMLHKEIWGTILLVLSLSHVHFS